MGFSRIGSEYPLGQTNMAKVLIPKRKTEQVGDFNEISRTLSNDYITAHIQEIYRTLQYWVSFLDGKYSNRLQIPVGTDMTSGTSGEIWIEGTNLHYIDENEAEQDLANFDQDLNTTDSVEFCEVLLTPKSSSTGDTGTIYYDSDDDHFHLKVP